ncbi:MAG TPA: TetR/AcrR family transcriptional regulator [Sporichthyaceae bacterium]
MAVGSDPAPSRDRECYFKAAYDLLADGGYGALTVTALCDRVGVTKGSFYHHFTDLPDFVAAFAQRWQSWMISLIDSYLAEPDLLRRIEMLANSHVVAMVGAEPAIRAWGWVDPSIGQAVRAVDAQGVLLGQDTFGGLAEDAETGLMLTRIGIGVLIGLQLRADPVDPDRFVEILAEWMRRCLHVDLKPVRVNGRSCVRAVGRTAQPISPLAPVARVSAPADPLREADAAAVAHAAASLLPSAARGKLAWFRAAREIMVEQGSDAVTVAALCERLRVTKGSFHHHFATMPGFIASLTDYWESAFNALLEVAAREPDPLRRLELHINSSLSLETEMETAWMAWGWSNPVIGAAWQRLERQGEDNLTRTLFDVLGDLETATLVAEMSTGLSIGMHAWRPIMDRENIALIGVEWLRRCVGLDADLCLVDGVPRVVNIRR